MISTFSILITVIGANLSVIVICLVGALLLNSNTINQEFLNQLSRVIEKVLLPSLILTSFLKSITIGELWHILPVAVSAFLVCAVGYLVGLISSQFWIKDKQFKSIIVLACSNPHTVSIQLQITYCLQYLLERLQKRQMYESSVDTTTRAITSIMIFSTVANTLRWTIGKSLLQKMAQEDERQRQIQLPLIQFSEIIPSNQNQIADDVTNLSYIQVESHSLTDKLKNIMIRISQVSMPLLAIILSIILMILYPIQRSLLDRQSFFHQSIYSPLQTIGRASTPCVLIMLGANMCSIVQKGQGQQGQNNNNISEDTLLKITFTRLIIVPIVGIMVLHFLVTYKFLEDPVVIFVTFLTYISPSAVNILVQAKTYKGNEDVVSLVLVYSYFCAILTLPIWIILFFAMQFRM